jgi:hypothetical protein
MEARAAIARLENDLRQQKAAVAALELELDEAAAIVGDDRREEADSIPVRPVAPSAWSADHHVLLRCEGFLVESATGRDIGVVTGFRFETRINRPDLLEIDVGRFRQHTVLVPIEQIESISAAEERIVLSHDRLRDRDLAHALLGRVRSHVTPSPSPR